MTHTTTAKEVSALIDAKLLHWCATVAEHDYDAAVDYLSLKRSPSDTQALRSQLRKSPVESRRANDILRACNLPALPMTDPGVMGALRKVLSGKELSPVLIAGGDIADGYHRVSLAYALDPFDNVPCKLA
jgi:hypothetical protein